ncbi:hypothetical protein CPB86DRAFT_283656 [Serendipita vermifera]|nr:hypothetical protein CPB86DRAFT_283656 [Serendipita vermifera]
MDYHLIAVMGPTGSGKSTFINLASKSNMKVGNSLKSCTAEVVATAPFPVGDKWVVLLDTPGFEDTKSSDFDILDEIASYLEKTYKDKKLLDGILFFQNISNTRMTNIAVRNLRIFESLCGDDPLESVVVVTNFWGEVSDPKKGTEREQELIKDPDFFGQILRGGATLKRHLGTEESSQKILSELLVQNESRRKFAILAIQTEMVDENLRLDETTAAAELIRDFDTMIQHLKRRVEKQRCASSCETPRERKERERSIKKMEIRIQQLEERKVNIGKKNGSLRLHAAFLRWVRSMFS